MTDLNTSPLSAGSTSRWTEAELSERLAVLTIERDDALTQLARTNTELEQRLAERTGSEERTRRQVDRLEALWQIANNPELRGEELMLAMLRQAAAAIRGTQRFRGILGRIENGSVVALALGVHPDDVDPHGTLLVPGTRAPLAQTMISPGGRSVGWDDLATAENVPDRIRLLGWCSLLSTQFTSDGSRYSLAFASLEPTTTAFGEEDIAYIDVLASSFANQLQVTALERSLREEEEHSRWHAKRLEALWLLVNDPTLHDADLWLAMLGQAADAIQPGQDYRGALWRVQGPEQILEAIVYPPGHLASASDNQIGRTVSLATSVSGRILAEGGGTRSWDDIEKSPYADVTKSRAHRMRSFVVTTFKAGGSSWFLSFASDTPTSRNLGPREHAYIEMLASFFANHMQQRWQFDRIEYQQSHDALTGLLNRSQFRSQARAAARTDARYAIALVDVNAFREVNESFGHMIGDAVLVEIASALRERMTGDEIIGRVGGDVFAIYLPNPTSAEVVKAKLLGFADVFAHGFSTGDRSGKDFVARTASIAAAMAPGDGTTIDAILSHADAALLVAKSRGHASIAFYEAGMEGDATQRATLRNELADALAGEQFTLYYQPHVEISTGAVTGCEALIRWNHPTRGLVLPGHFIPFAEQTGMIASIDDWVMQHALVAAKDFSGWWPDFRLYFNLSGRQSGDRKLIHAFSEAARNGLTLSNVGVEITETDAMRDVEATRRVCRGLRRLGVRIAIDDFGTGYSSLSSLKRLPLDIVKIDRTFIKGVLDDPDDEAIAKTIISITKYFGFDSLAEGAEQMAEVEWLRQHACRYVQGYAVCHPLPLDAFVAWVNARRADPAA